CREYRERKSPVLDPSTEGFRARIPFQGDGGARGADIGWIQILLCMRKGEVGWGETEGPAESPARAGSGAHGGEVAAPTGAGTRRASAASWPYSFSRWPLL